jgi:predicted DNA-binding transcriptional regulator AlpA
MRRTPASERIARRRVRDYALMCAVEASRLTRLLETFDLSALLRDPTRVSALPTERIAAFITQLSSLQTALAARLIVEAKEPADDDTLLTVEEASKCLGVSTHWLCRRTRVLPFVVRLGGDVRFSKQGIDRFLKNRVGRR